jgi:uncharacterized membrane protein
MAITLILLVICILFSRKKSSIIQNSQNIETNNKSIFKHVSVWIWVAVWIIVLANACAVYLALWLEYTPIGEPGVNGIQYRYFVPFMPLLYLLWIDCIQHLRSLRNNTLTTKNATA